MANYSIKTDLLKLQGAFVTNIKGKTATKQCLCIPIAESGLFLGKQGCYLNLTAIEMQNPQYNDTHCIKPDIPRDKREAMTKDEQNAIPIVGGLHAIEIKQPTMQVNGTMGADAFADEDLPF